MYHFDLTHHNLPNLTYPKWYFFTTIDNNLQDKYGLLKFLFLNLTILLICFVLLFKSIFKLTSLLAKLVQRPVHYLVHLVNPEFGQSRSWLKRINEWFGQVNTLVSKKGTQVWGIIPHRTMWAVSAWSKSDVGRNSFKNVIRSFN